MTNRFAHIHRLVALRAQFQRNPDDIDQQMKRAIIDALPPGYRKVYDWIGSLYTPVTTAMVMRAWELKSNHASTLLNELWRFGLLKRTEIKDSHGKMFEYKHTADTASGA